MAMRGVGDRDHRGVQADHDHADRHGGQNPPWTAPGRPPWAPRAAHARAGLNQGDCHEVGSSRKGCSPLSGDGPETNGGVPPLLQWQPGVVIPPRTTGCRAIQATSRADAERNRERIVVAASRLFAEQGLSVPPRGCRPRRHGRRHALPALSHPHRPGLHRGVRTQHMSSHIDTVEKALAKSAAGEGFRPGLDLQRCRPPDRPARAAHHRSPASSVIEQPRGRRDRRQGRRGDRPRPAGGALRRTSASATWWLLLLANAGVLEVTFVNAPQAWRRLRR